MKLRGGYNINLAGRPDGRLESLPEPDVLSLPLDGPRLAFSRVLVTDGQPVRQGQALARDPRLGLPLIAPRGGTLRHDGQNLRIENPQRQEALPVDEPAEADPRLRLRARLVEAGAWNSVFDAHTGAVADPRVEPEALIVSTIHREPFCARGDVQIEADRAAFLEAIERLQTLLAYQPIHLVVPKTDTPLARQIVDDLRGHAYVRPLHIPPDYGLDDFHVLARHLGYRPSGQRVWALRVEGVLAVGEALRTGRAVCGHVVSIGGPAAADPRHVRAMAGYPLDAMAGARGGCRILDGGVFRGMAVEPDQQGLAPGCTGLTLLPDAAERTLLGFARPGLSTRSFSRWYASSLRGGFVERMTTALRGERRACVACDHCRRVCPAGLMPHLIHKALHAGDLDEAEALGLDLCVACGLCSFVCPSKLELRRQFVEAQAQLAAEHVVEGGVS